MRGVLLDIEGTTTPIRFVYDTLFPYARAHTESFLGDHAGDPDIHEVIVALKREHAAEIAGGASVPPWTDDHSAVAYALWLMDRDRKSTALKRLQGLIWQSGYAAGELRGEVFPDVPPALEAWSRSGVDVRIFSSGSVLAQKLLFSTTAAGDLTRFLRGHFDTETGAKSEPGSYTQIARQFGLPAGEIVFVSDVTRELDAARAAGMEPLLAVRPGNAPQEPGSHRVIASFDEIA